MLNVLHHNFFVERTTPGTGEILTNFLCNDLTIAVSGNATGLDATVYGKLGDSWYPLGLVSMTDFATLEKIEENGLYGVAGITGVESIKVVLNTISSGNVTMVGRLM